MDGDRRLGDLAGRRRLLTSQRRSLVELDRDLGDVGGAAPALSHPNRREKDRQDESHVCVCAAPDRQAMCSLGQNEVRLRASILLNAAKRAEWHACGQEALTHCDPAGGVWPETAKAARLLSERHQL